MIDDVWDVRNLPGGLSLECRIATWVSGPVCAEQVKCWVRLNEFVSLGE